MATMDPETRKFINGMEYGAKKILKQTRRRQIEETQRQLHEEWVDDACIANVIHSYLLHTILLSS